MGHYKREFFDGGASGSIGDEGNGFAMTRQLGEGIKGVRKGGDTIMNDTPQIQHKQIIMVNEMA